MILGLGTDIVELTRIAAMLDKFGRRFIEKILTAAEIAAMPENSPSSLGGRFAAKEAAAKALGSGFSAGITLHHIEIFNDICGAPRLRFLNQAAARVAALGVTRSFVSVSHERTLSVAVVVLEA
ncbi:MAG: 4'-phosphopantetheinyl transferase [Candidatus Desulfovibrio kirbyi]|uniref:Holo-[acyl-carrier-protein] synthase n=1 Tax=Candidatus Desulfovibrio kirbyi TaxID=2696086 RepID=A0A6L2R6V4_9BACT|nr:MAG: 4'-phosphopantetheinyl transferase [Candidatus Desulfovibrio kirbyi]